jgi:hypothetical protein
VDRASPSSTTSVSGTTKLNTKHTSTKWTTAITLKKSHLGVAQFILRAEAVLLPVFGHSREASTKNSRDLKGRRNLHITMRDRPNYVQNAYCE